MKLKLVVIGTFLFTNLILSQTYTTVQDGLWTNASTWDANGIPPINLNNDTVNLNHRVELTSTLKLQGNSNLNVNNLFDITGNVEIENSTDTVNISFGVIIAVNGDLINKHGTINFDYGRFQSCNGNYKDESNGSGGSFGIGTISTDGGNIENTNVGNFSSGIEWCSQTGGDINMVIPENCALVLPPGSNCNTETVYLTVICLLDPNDTDNDGVSDICDQDDDNDGILDAFECSVAIQLDNVSTLTASNMNDLQVGEKVNVISKLRINLKVSNKVSRDLLLGFSEFTTDDFDYGYDARNTDKLNDDDLNLGFGDDRMIMQAFGPITREKEVPLMFKASGNYTYSISITDIENINQYQDIFLKDNYENLYFDLKDADYEFTSEEGEFNDRFQIVFNSPEVDNADLNLDGLVFFYNRANKRLYIKGLEANLSDLKVSNILGQDIINIKDIHRKYIANEGVQLNHLASGVHLVKIISTKGQSAVKKIVIN